VGLSFTRCVTLAPAKPGNSSLTPREGEVLGWVARGKSGREIGEILHITERTVQAHVQAAIHKLGGRNRLHALAIALRDGIIKV
jgi:LuxR family transcriptional regulator, quorum-sensing system regulator BjaR1